MATMRNPTQISIPILGAAGWLAALALAAGGIAGCRVHVNKGANGQDKSVQVETPFGGLHVNTGQTTAADLGLPAYPGAQMVALKDNDKSADVHMGFGEWELRVKTVNYSTPDSQAKVEAFYQKALGRYGDVIRCQDGVAVGVPTSTSEGLSCDDKDHTRVQVDGDGFPSGNGFELKAGSERYQHIVAFVSSPSGQTRFSLVELELPAAAEGGGKSD